MRSTVYTLLLTAAITGTGVGLMTGTPTAPLLAHPASGPSVAVLTVLLAAAFFTAELGQALVEVRRQAYSFSLSGVPLLLGLLYLPLQHLIAARLLGAVLAFALQRASAMKFAFNTGSYILDTALVVVLSHQLVPPATELTLRTAGLCYATLWLVDVVMSLLVLLVIRINQGPVSASEVGEVLAPAGAFVLLNTTIALISAMLIDDGALGGLLLFGFAVVMAAVYRGFLTLRARHQSLEVVQTFIQHSEDAGSVEELAEVLLSRLRLLLRASRVELTLLHDGSEEDLHLMAEDDGVIVGTQSGPVVLDALVAASMVDGTPLLIGRRRKHSAAWDRWLEQRGAQDALVVPLSRSGARGVVLAVDRLGEATAFTAGDLALLQTLAGHLAVALHSRRLVQRLRTEATHDALTGLPNRTLLVDRVHSALSEAGATPPAVLLLDLNRFKEVNDALGHHVGDEVLKVVATRLRDSIREEATVARLGGDEFAVLLPPDEAGGTGSGPDAAEAAAVVVAQRIAVALSTPIELPDVTVSTEASVGVAVAGPGQTHADLLRHADTAMYAAKAAGHHLAVFSPELDKGRADRLALLADLHLALDRDQLELHYQPKLDLALGEVTSVEALVRWTHPTLGPLSPDVFVPLAESTGLIEHLTQTVLDKALRQCRTWQESGLDLAVAVNLSARNVNNTALPDQVAAALAGAALPAHRLILEITESSVMGDADRTVPTLERLVALGVTLSLDDFGTGYSSLSYLQRLPVRELKIDRSFILGLSQVPTDRGSELLVRSIIAMAQGLGLRVVAEGVESLEVLERLREMGCDIIQGYYVGRPTQGERISELPWLKRNTPPPASFLPSQPDRRALTA